MLFRSLIIGISAMLGGFEPAAMPGVLAGLAQIFLGTQLGVAFKRHDLMAVRAALPAILVNVGILTVGCAAVAIALAAGSGASAPSFVLGTSPGGVTEMCLTARALGLEVPLVVGFHVSRVIIVMSATPWIFAVLRRSGLIELPSSHHHRS